jgi:ABC-type nitrate/sulfonate/bicarbonate transport system substrate-binding protein
MKTTLPRYLISLLLLSLLVVISGCTSPSTPATQGSTNFPVVRWALFKNYDPVFVAQAKGFFTQERVRVDFVGQFASGPAIVQAAGTNNVDGGQSALTGLINGVSHGVQVIGVADSQTEFTNAPLQQWFVLQNSPIKTAQDLKGRKIGVNSLAGSFYYTFLLYLQKHGMTKSDVQFVVIPHNNQEQALRSRQIDVAGLIDPYSVHIQQQGGVRTLFRGVDVLGENQFSLIFFRKDFVNKNPEVVKRFVQAYQQAIQFIYTHPTEANSIISQSIGISADLTGVHHYTPNAEVRMQDVQFWINLLRQFGNLQDNGALKPTDVATTRFTS